jgi:maltodextrin utilization protein YvdJ
MGSSLVAYYLHTQALYIPDYIVLLLGLVISLAVVLSVYCVFLGGSLIAWKTKKQVADSHSSAKAELHAMPFVTTDVT